MRKLLIIVLFIISGFAFARGPGDVIPTERLAGEVNGALTNRQPDHLETLFSNPDLALSIHEDVSKRLVHRSCLTVAPVQVCKVEEVPLPHDHVEFMSQFTRRAGTQLPDLAPSVRRDCGCLQEQLGASKDPDIFEKEKKLEREKLNATVLNALGKRFINKFTVNFEDASFFLTANTKIFSDPNTAASIQCDSPALYESKIQEVCGQRNIRDAAFIETRKNLLINALSADVPKSFSQRIEDIRNGMLSRRITTRLHKELRDQGPASANLEHTEERVYPRAEYDLFRKGLVVDSDKGKSVNIVISQLLRNDAYFQKITEYMVGNKLPYDAIFRIIDENKNNPEFITSMGLKAGDFSKYFRNSHEIHKSLGFMVNIHPGFMNAMRNKGIFNQLHTSVKARPEYDAITTLENDKSIIEPYMKKSCEDLVQNFANAVCIPEENLLSSISPEELEKMMHEETGEAEEEHGIELHQLVICEAQNKVGNSDFNLNALADTNRMRESDYVQDSRGEGRSNIGLVIGAMSSSNGQLAEQIGRYTDSGRRTSGTRLKGVWATRVQAEAVASGRAVSMGRNTMSQSTARTVLAEEKSYDERIASSSNTAASSAGAQAQATSNVAPVAVPTLGNSQAQVSAPTTVAPSVPMGLPQTSGNYASNSKEALRNYIDDKNQNEEVARTVNSLDNGTADELARLRSEKAALLEQTLKAESAKLESMRAQVEELNAKSNEFPNRLPAAVTDAGTDDDDEEIERSSGRSAPNLPDAKVSNAGGATSGAGGQVSQATTGSNIAAKVNASETTPNAAVTNVQPDGGQTQATSGALTISSAEVRNGNIQPQEINSEVQKFLQNPDLNLSSIETLKSKGIVLRYSVMENNKLVQKEVVVKYENLDAQTRNAIDLKLARKSVNNQVSKLAVLKMLIKQNQRL